MLQTFMQWNEDWISVAVVFQICWCRGILRKQFPQKSISVDRSYGDPGDPLFLTPYIEKGDIETGKYDTQHIAVCGVVICYVLIRGLLGDGAWFSFFPHSHTHLFPCQSVDHCMILNTSHLFRVCYIHCTCEGIQNRALWSESSVIHSMMLLSQDRSIYILLKLFVLLNLTFSERHHSLLQRITVCWNLLNF